MPYDHQRFFAQYSDIHGAQRQSQHAGLEFLLSHIEQDVEITDVR